MSPENFCYWLQGFFELTGIDESYNRITPEQLAAIKEHLNLVFKKVTGNSGAVTADKLAPTGPISVPPMRDLTNDPNFQKIVEELQKNRPNREPWRGPYPGTSPLDPWWFGPQILCSAGADGPSGLRVECMDVSKTSDADLDNEKICSSHATSSVSSTNAREGVTYAVNAMPQDPNKPIFIC